MVVRTTYMVQIIDFRYSEDQRKALRNKTKHKQGWTHCRLNKNNDDQI